MAVLYFGMTDTGRIRDNNEDAFIADKVLDDRYVLACVIDGVGGYEGGEVAAAIARQTLRDYFAVLSGDIPTMMQEAMRSANEKIFTEKHQNRRNSQMACVVTMALADVANNRFYYAHVGDTRLYLLRDDTLVKITKDHSFVGFLEDTGRLSEEAAMRHPKRNEIDKALGFDPQLPRTGDYIETGESPFLPGDVLLLCSDGLSDLVSNREMTSILASAASLEEKGKQLVEAANNKGGKDNITVVLVQNTAVPRKDKATKPVAPVKKNDRRKSPAHQPEAPVNATPAPPVQKSARGWILFLSILCFLLAGALILSLLHRRQATGMANNFVPITLQQSPQEQLLLQALQANRDTIVLTDLLFGNTISLTDTLMIQKDTLHIIGNGNTVLEADSAFRGPALFLTSSVKYLVLENLTFRNFAIAIAAQNGVVQLRRVQFSNCRVPVQYNLTLPNEKSVQGRISDSLLFKTDSLPQQAIQLPDDNR